MTTLPFCSFDPARPRNRMPRAQKVAKQVLGVNDHVSFSVFSLEAPANEVSAMIEKEQIIDQTFF